MGLADVLTREGTRCSIKAQCKREVLQQLAETASDLVGTPADEILATLIEREQLGSTGVGDGVAIPHGKIDGLKSITGVLARLDKPVSFDSIDDQPVDLVFLLLAPANATAAHLKALAKVSRLLRDPATREALRGAETSEALFAIAIEEKTDAA